MAITRGLVLQSRASSSRAPTTAACWSTLPVFTSTENASRSPYQPPVEYTDAYAVLSPARMLTLDTATADGRPRLVEQVGHHRLDLGHGAGHVGGRVHLPAPVDGRVPQVVHRGRVAVLRRIGPGRRIGEGIVGLLHVDAEDRALRAQREAVGVHVQIRIAIGVRPRVGRVERHQSGRHGRAAGWW